MSEAAPPRPPRASPLLFIALGGLSFATQLGGTAALAEGFGVAPRTAYAVMLAVVLAGNFFANRRLVFPAARAGRAGAQALRFAGASAAFRAIEYVLVTHLLISVAGQPYPLAITLGTGLMLGIKYLVFSAYVFR